MTGRLKIQKTGGEARTDLLFNGFKLYLQGGGRLGKLVTILKLNAVRWVATMKSHSCLPYGCRAKGILTR